MKKHILSILFLLCIVAAKAQIFDNPIIIEIAVLPPYSTSAVDYFTSSTQTVITVINPSPIAFDVYFAGGITNITTQQGARIRNDIVPPVPPLRIEPGIRILTGNDLTPYVSSGSLEYNGLSEQDAINGNLPEGEYQICLQVYDYATTQLRSQPEPAGCSNIFTIQFIQPPILIAPACSSEVIYLPVQNIVFSWIPPPLALLQNTILSYEFRLIEVPQGMTSIHAMQAVTVPVMQENTLFNTFIYSALNPPLIPGRLYAWRVKVSDLNNNIQFSNNGESEICEFRYGLPNPLLTPMTANIAYPSQGSRVPFQRVPIIAKYEPVDNSYRYLTTTTQINDQQGLHDLIEIQSNWPEGPDAALQQQISAPPTLTQLQHVQIGRNLATFPGAAEVKAGTVYTVNTTMNFELEGGGSKTAMANGVFTRGLYKPILREPRLDTVFLNQNRIRFRFKTSDPIPPVAGQFGLLPSAEVIKAVKGNTPNLFKAEVLERYRLEVAADVNFDSIVVRHSDMLRVEEQITPSTNVNFLKSRIYRDLNKELYLADTGTYYWRVHWLVNPLDSASAPYETSQVERFRIMGTPAADTTRAACMADCDAAPIADRNPSNALQPGDIVKVGKFDMTVQTVQYSGPEASGMGLIPVPFMNTTVKVQYTNIKVNAQKEMFFGNVAARQDTIGFMPNIPGLGQLQVTNREELFEYVKRDRYSSVFDPSVPMGLPFGIDKVVDGDRYMIAIVGMSFTHERATMSAAVSFPLPFLPKRSSDNKQQQLGLGASSICFHPDGLAGLGIGALFLFDPIEFDYAPGQYIKFMNSNMDPITGMVADSGTYVSWDCDGFRALHVKGEISFSNELLTRPVVRYKSKAEELRNRPLGNRDVKARFKLNVRRSGNWLAMLDMDPFSINGIEDWNFVVKEATLDFSDLENPPNMVFPENYSGDRSILWNGFHLKRVQVGLPEDLRLRFPSNEELEDPTGKDSVLVDRIVVNLTDLLIDRTGISGKIFALNLIDLKDGDLNGWSFSIDTLSLEFVSNSFTRGGFNGNILTPLTPDQFKYRTLLSQSSDSSGLRFSFNVLPVDTITVPLWAATMNILPTSRITIEADTGGFKPQLILNGSIDIMQKIGEVDVRFAGVRFQELKLQTMEPMLSCSSFTFSSPQKLMAGFPVSVSNIQLTSQNYHGLFSWDDTPGPRQALQFTVSVNFTGEENTFGGSTTLAILGRFDMGDLLMGGEEYPSLKLTGIDLKTINIQGDLGFVKIKGFINFYAEDSLYGQGFVGGIDATFIQCINVAVIGCFGEVNDMRYWYVDAMAKFNPGINLSVPSVPPVPIPVDLYGFGGGAFYKMSLQEPPPPDAPISTKTLDGTPTPGTTLSNLRLVPNPDAFFGLMATVVLGSTGGGQAFNCDLTMAVTINNNGGINQIGFSGSGYFMSSVFERDFTAVRADASLIMDMPSRTLTGNLTVMINVPLVLQGRQPNNIAGSAHLYMGPDHWKILVGQPEPEASRVGVRIVDAFDANAYLMAGQQLPPPAQLPSAVTNALGNITPPRSPKISNGTGFAFGASLTPPKFEDTYLMFNAKLDATVGFDLNMFDYGATRCDNMKPGEKLGINGWYANGQIWGHFIGSIGISIDLWGEPINQEILSVNAAALLTAGFPNPAWFKGAVGGNYNIMGGLVSGYCNFKLSYGNSCAPPQESPMAGVKIIADLSPNAGETNVDCGIYPNAVFNVDINRNYSFEEILSDGTKRQRTFRFEIESFTIKRGSSILSRTISTSNDGSQSCIMPNDLLTGNNSHSVSITVVCKERINNIWKIAKRNNNSEIRETVSKNFTTGPKPDHVRPQDVTYSYPLHNQKHYAYNHCEKGQVRLKQGRSDLFSEAPPAGYTRSYIAYFIPTNGGTRLEGSVSFADQFRTILFNMPNLSPSTLYKVEIVRKDRIATLAGFENLNNFQAVSNTGFQSFANVFGNLADGNSTLRSRSLSASQMRSTGEHLLYSFHFKTSQYATLDAKITALNVTNNQRMYEGSNERVDLTLQGPERLDIHEVFGYEYINGNTLYLFKFMHIEDQYSSTWHTSYLNTDIYDLYNRIVNNNYSTMRIFRSNPDYKGGIPPKRVYMAMSLAQPLSNQDIDPSSGGSGPILSGSGISFAIPSQPTSIISITTSEDARADYNRLRSIVTDMRTRLGNNLSGVDATTRTKANNLMSTPFKNIFAGTSHNIRFFTPSSISRCNPQNTMSRTKTFSIPSNQPVYQISTSTVTFFN